jgi:RNA-directed DNA polymerase
MKEPYGKGLATRTGPESCIGVHKGSGEARTGVPAGWVLSRENTVNRGADALDLSGRPHRASRHRERRPAPARSETPCMPGNTLHGNREILRLSEGKSSTDRTGKPKGARR